MICDVNRHFIYNHENILKNWSFYNSGAKNPVFSGAGVSSPSYVHAPIHQFSVHISLPLSKCHFP